MVLALGLALGLLRQLALALVLVMAGAPSAGVDEHGVALEWQMLLSTLEPRQQQQQQQQLAVVLGGYQMVVHPCCSWLPCWC